MALRRRSAVGVPIGARFAGAAAAPADPAFAAPPADPAPPARPVGARFARGGRHAAQNGSSRRSWPFATTVPHGAGEPAPVPPARRGAPPGIGARGDRGIGRLGGIAPA